jgi:hypothetical protein
MVPCAKASTTFSGGHDDRRDTARAVRPRVAACAAHGVPRGGLDFHCERPHVLGRSAAHGLSERSDADGSVTILRPTDGSGQPPARRSKDGGVDRIERLGGSISSALGRDPGAPLRIDQR